MPIDRAGQRLILLRTYSGFKLALAMSIWRVRLAGRLCARRDLPYSLRCLLFYLAYLDAPVFGSCCHSIRERALDDGVPVFRERRAQMFRHAENRGVVRHAVGRPAA